MAIRKKPSLDGASYLFPLTMWLSSRLLLILGMVAIAPLFPPASGDLTPRFGWDVFAGWDGELYKSIVTNGYLYNVADNAYTVAFFPLFPLLCKALTLLGLPFSLAGFMVNNLAFLGAVLLIFNWVKDLYDLTVARWTVVVLTWCPFSLFGTVTYTEGLFLLTTSAALRAFSREQLLKASVFGALATATRLPSLALIPTFLWVCWQEKRSPFAYLASLGAGLGVLLYSLYCWQKFGDPLIFLQAQRAWQPAQDFWGQDWLKMLLQVLVGSRNWRAGTLKDPWHPLLIVVLSILAYGLGRSPWGQRQKLWGYSLLAVIFWLVAGTPLVNTVTVFGGVYLVWYFRRELNILAVYGFWSFVIIFSSGRATSAERYTYGIISVIIALGLGLARYPRWRYPVSIFFAFFLVSLALRFAQGLWAG